VPTLMITVSESPTPAASQSAILATPRRNALSPVSRLKRSLSRQSPGPRRGALARRRRGVTARHVGPPRLRQRRQHFLWEGDKLVTPAEECGILPGITRAAVIELAERMKIEVAEDMIAPQRLARADGAFLTNSLIA